jgi:hypothetical protein
LVAFAALFLCPLLITYSATAQKATSSRWTGYLLDVACARDRKDKEPLLGEHHTRKCLQMPACDRSGFGILTDTNELLRFDEDGNRRVRRLLRHTRKENKLRCVAWGSRSNDILQLNQIELIGR